MAKSRSSLSKEQTESLLQTIQNRFEKNKTLQNKIKWEDVAEKLKSNPDKLWSLFQMEATGGEPALIDYNIKSKEFIFFDCVAESPKNRRSLCYDDAALASRKQNKPDGSALAMAEQMRVEILDEEEYRFLQQHMKADTKTSSWIKTPQRIRKLGGAIFGDYRYGQVLIYHNGAESYYAARGFRAKLKV